ncbi:hypothetical protein M8C21_019330 [Ambrosia artemisiifolia]|uniref:Uncharacterized protein n=1 Tax=Ambrosia artemisiifolia TaxID=4212 RepID=A0AAD5BSE5_AMBAR|nr:hypothetical protein M8C21_019330 [Ambrosia artemisiifolia]
MDSNSPATVNSTGVNRSGGKILKKKTNSVRKTPYDRPDPNPQPENSSNWRNGLLFPAKIVAGGAKVGIEDENLPDADAELNQDKGSSSGKGEILYLIEQLVMLEHFSREECDRLIKIINSRVVDYTMKEGMDAAPNGKSFWCIMEDSKRNATVAFQGRRAYEAKRVDTKKTQDDVPTETLSSLPTIDEQNLIAEEKNVKDDKTGDDLSTEYAEVADVVNASQGSSNTSDPPTSTKVAGSPSVNRPVTRTRKYNTRRSRGRGK